MDAADHKPQTLQPVGLHRLPLCAEFGMKLLPILHSDKGLTSVLALLLGIALQLNQTRLWSIWEYFLLLATACLCLFWVASQRNRFCSGSCRIIAVWALLAVVAFAWPGVRAAWMERNRMPLAWEGQEVLVTGVIASMPRLQAGSMRFRFYPEHAVLASGEVFALTQMMDVAWFVPQRELLSKDAHAMRDEAQVKQATQQALPALYAGDRWTLPLRLRIPYGQHNPKVFDYEQWLWQQGVQVTALVSQQKAADIQAKGTTHRYLIERWRQITRDRILNQLDSRSAQSADAANSPNTSRAAGILAALVTGDQRAISQADWQVFRITGVAHLMAISGLHITMFAWLAIAVVRTIWRRFPACMHWLPTPIAALWGGMLCATVYAVFSGWEVPAQRTVLMLFCWVLVRSAGLHWSWLSTLSFAAVVVLVVDPWAVMQPGFWLSFVAVAVLFWLAASSARPSSAEDANAPADAAQGDAEPRRVDVLVNIRLWLQERIRPAVWQSARQLWQLQWRLSLVLIPLTLTLFGQLAWVGLVANLVAIPLVTLLVTPLAMLGALTSWPLWLAEHFLAPLLLFLDWLTTWPMAEVMWPKVPWWWAMVGLIGIVLMISSVPLWLRLQGLVCVLLLMLWRGTVPTAGEFRVLALDVGQGTAVLVQTHQHVLLYDSGPRYSPWRDAGQSIVVPVLAAHGWKPDVMVLSHSDTDHVGGAHAVLQAHPQMRLLAPFPSRIWREILDVSEKPVSHLSEEAATSSAQLHFERCELGLSWEWDGVQFRFLAPSSALLDRTYSTEPAESSSALQPLSSNATSCVLQVRSSSGQVALLTGDIGRLQEFDLVMELGDTLRADWLLIPHHGSRFSSSDRWVQAVQPSFAVAQAGYRNGFGHPHPQVMQAYQAVGAQAIATPWCGALSWSTEQPERTICEREANQRYWHTFQNQPYSPFVP